MPDDLHVDFEHSDARPEHRPAQWKKLVVTAEILPPGSADMRRLARYF